MYDPDLDGLQDPDGEEDAQYNWDTEFQKHIITLLLVDRQFLVTSIDLVRPSYFTNKAHQKACASLFSFFKKYKAMPHKTFILQAMKEEFEEDKGKDAYIGEIKSLYDYFKPGLEGRDYLSDKILNFSKAQALKQAFQECLKLIGKAPEAEETWSRNYEILRKAMNVERNLDPGLDYFLSMQERYERMKEEENSPDEKFVTGYMTIDHSIKGGGYNKGEMVLVAAPSGVGKSVWLTCVGARNVLRKKKLLYITLELSEDRVAERFDSILTGCDINCLYDLKEDVFARLETISSDWDDKKNRIVVKHFPGRTVDVNTIRGYISQLKFFGFVPDMVVVDYVGEMKMHTGMKPHESLELIISELRSLANEGEKFFLATAIQTNADGKKTLKDGGRIDEEHAAGSYGQWRPVDGGYGLMQSELEKGVNIGRLFVIKQRFGKAKFDCYVQFDAQTLEIKEISQAQYGRIFHGRAEQVANGVAKDMVGGKPVRPYKPDKEDQPEMIVDDNQWETDGDSSAEDEQG